jgi:protein involved in sex pheromone biosynthesis
MKKIILLTAVVLILISCGSKKGSWTEEDKKKASDYIKKSEGSLEFLGTSKQQFIDCYLEKVEKKYDNFDASTADSKGTDSLTASCFVEMLMRK